MEGVQGWRGCTSDVIKYMLPTQQGPAQAQRGVYFFLKKILCSRLNGKVTQWLLELIQVVETR
jgi:hypothetical protein